MYMLYIVLWSSALQVGVGSLGFVQEAWAFMSNYCMIRYESGCIAREKGEGEIERNCKYFRLDSFCTILRSRKLQHVTNNTAALQIMHDVPCWVLEAHSPFSILHFSTLIY